MKLYDECLIGMEELVADFHMQPLDLTGAGNWKDLGNNQVLFAADTAYELGGKGLPAVSSIALTDKESFVPKDEVYLIGKDLPELSSDSPIARIAFLRVNEEEMGTGQKLYAMIRKIEYTRYHLSPEGYMLRISAFSHREAVRVGKEGLRKGLNFAKVGQSFIDAYKKNASVEAVKLFFITDPAFPYKKLEDIMERSEQITTALDHLMKDVKMDCATCGLKEVCEEVEELTKKDFDQE